MRHNKKFNHLGRKSAHRKAMLSNMATSLILHKRIKTTEAKAKALRMYVEPLITKSKNDSTHNRRTVFAYLRSKEAVTELFREVSMKVADRPGGYTRIIKLGKRLGDNAEMCMIELVDFNEHMLSTKETKKKSRRSRRGGSKKTTQTSTPTSETKKAEKPAEEVKEESTKAEVEVKEETPKAEVKEETPEVVEKPKAEAKKEEAKVEETKKEETSKAEAKKEEAPKTDDSKEEEKKA